MILALQWMFGKLPTVGALMSQTVDRDADSSGWK